MTDLSVSDYSEKAIVVRGEDSKSYSQQLSSLGGKYNALLRGGPGWIFPKKKEVEILTFVNSGKVEKEKENEDEDILVTLSKMFASMTSEQRLDFLSKIANLAVKREPVKPVSYAKPIQRTMVKPVVKSKPFAKPATVITSDCDESDDEPVARPRLLAH